MSQLKTFTGSLAGAVKPPTLAIESTIARTGSANTFWASASFKTPVKPKLVRIRERELMAANCRLRVNPQSTLELRGPKMTRGTDEVLNTHCF